MLRYSDSYAGAGKPLSAKQLNNLGQETQRLVAASKNLPAGEQEAKAAIIKEAAIKNDNADLIPFGARTIYPINPTTGLVDYSFPERRVLWTGSPSAKDGGPSYCLPVGLFRWIGDRFVTGFALNHNTLAHDGTQFGTVASWNGTLPRLLWGTVSFTGSLPVQFFSKVALFSNNPNVPFGYGEYYNPPYIPVKYVLPEISNAGTIMRDVYIIRRSDVIVCLNNMGLINKYGARECDLSGASVTSTANSSPYCFLGGNNAAYSAKTVISSLGLVTGTNYSTNYVLIGVASPSSVWGESFFQVVQVQHNKAPNYVAPPTTPSGTLGAPLGAPLGG